ncbi:MAG: hypothetical protein EXS36_04280 [Pedosphaera sp.]|nr:hypothetical protein [Pedosphaera sp.]
METPAIQARRATLDDLPALLELWQATGLPGEQLEQFLTEFQLVSDEQGSLCAAVGLLIHQQDGLIHSEAIAAGADADTCRAALWRRTQIVARNAGITRLWTPEEDPFWIANGFHPATPAEVADMPTAIANPDTKWFLHLSMDPNRAKQIVNEQLAIWETSRMQDKEDFTRKIGSIRSIALLFAALIIGGAFVLAMYIFWRQPNILGKIFGR